MGARRNRRQRKFEFSRPARRSSTRTGRVPHVRREDFSPSCPIHVTVRVLHGVPNLRSRRAVRQVREAFKAARERLGMRITQYSIQAHHIHLVVEAKNRWALSRAMKGLCVRIARRLNRVSQRKGQVFADRYHAHVLRTPREVRNAVRYVMNNSFIHAERAGRPWRIGPDPFAGGPCPKRFFESCRALIIEPRTYLLRRAWNLPWRRKEAGPSPPNLSLFAVPAHGG